MNSLDEVWSVCPICFDKFVSDVIDYHIEECLELNESNMFTPEKKKYAEYELNETCKTAYKYCLKKSKILSKNVYPYLLMQFIALDYTEDDLKSVINYIKNDANVTINIHHEIIAKNLLKDDHYKNCFEIGTKHIAIALDPRFIAESSMFNKLYDNASSIDRVKYGSINLFNSSFGNPLCIGYGDSILVLKNEVKKRISFTIGDSFGMQFHIGTFEHSAIFLINIAEPLIHALIKFVRTKEAFTPAKVCELYTLGGIGYVEVQVHGLIRLNEDVEKLIIHKKNISKNIIAFCDKNNIELVEL